MQTNQANVLVDLKQVLSRKHGDALESELGGINGVSRAQIEPADAPSGARGLRPGNGQLAEDSRRRRAPRIRCAADRHVNGVVGRTSAAKKLTPPVHRT